MGSNFNYSHGKLLVILLASSSFFLALYLFKYSETKYSIVSWLDVSRKGDIPLPPPPNANEPDEPDQPSFNQRQGDRRHMDQLAESAGNRLGGLASGDDTEDEFKPTDRWQEVPESHRMQPGVQYRVNQSSGKVEARKETKTNDNQVQAGMGKAFSPAYTTEPSQIEAPPTIKPKDQSKPILMTTPIVPQPKQSDDQPPSKEQPKPLLMITPVVQQPADKQEPSKPTLMTTPIVPQDQPAEEQPSSETESLVERNMQNTLARYSDARTKGTKLGILQMLQHDLRDEDEAEAFMKCKGHLLFKTELETTTCKFTKAMIALIYGTLSGSFPHFKRELYDDGILKSLLEVLKKEDEYIILLPTIFAVTQMVRRFPAGQKSFVELQGVESLAKVFDKDDEDYQKLQIKVLNLLSYLKEDRLNLEEMLNRMKQHNLDPKAPLFVGLSERLQAYDSIHLEQQVTSDEYCSKAPAKFNDKQMVLKLRIVHWLSLYKKECSEQLPKLRPVLTQFLQDAQGALTEETDKDKQEMLKETLEELKSLLE